MATITKKDLIDRIAAESGCKRTDAKKCVQMTLDEIIKALGEGDRIELRGFGVFEVRERMPRKAQNPKTLEPFDVPPKKVVKFRAGAQLQRRVEGKTPKLSLVGATD